MQTQLTNNLHFHGRIQIHIPQVRHALCKEVKGHFESNKSVTMLLDVLEDEWACELKLRGTLGEAFLNFRVDMFSSKVCTI
jgi:hypothetical protein